MRVLSLLVALVLLALLLLYLRGSAAEFTSAARQKRAAAAARSARLAATASSPKMLAADAAPERELTKSQTKPDRFGLIRTPECWLTCGAPCVPDEAGAPVCPSECHQDEDCGADALCRVTRPRNPAVREFRCLSTQCEADADCGPGEACDVSSNWHATIGLCKWAGTRGAGEPCAHDLYDNPAGHCARGLHCVHGMCARNRCEADADCGIGQRCSLIAGLPYRQCLSLCESDADCAAGWTCYSDDILLMPRCVRQDALGCLAAGCPAGQECKVRFASAAFAMTECVRPCEADAECASGELCARVLADDRASCRLPCETDEDCPAPWWCPPVTDLHGGKTQSCLPQREAHEDAFYGSFDQATP